MGVGAMAAILGLESAKVIAGCAEAMASFGAGSTDVVEAVNFNDPAQTVIAGTKAGVEKACEVLKAAGAKRALPLPVSAPFHSSLMKPAAENCVPRLLHWNWALRAFPWSTMWTSRCSKTQMPSAMHSIGRPLARCAGWSVCRR